MTKSPVPERLKEVKEDAAARINFRAKERQG
jgi:hypothetical protein